MNKTEALPPESLQSSGRADPFLDNSSIMRSVPTERSGQAPVGAERAATSARDTGGGCEA